MSSSWRVDVQDKLLSFSTASNTTEIQGLAPSNTQALRCLPISQATRMMKGTLPFLSVLLWNASVHTMPPLVETSGSRLRIRGSQTNFFEDEQPNLFYETSQRGQAVGCGSPLLAKRSEVQNLFLIAIQIKNLQRSGAP